MVVIVWMNPDTAWESAVDVAARLSCEEVVLLLVTAGAPADLAGAICANPSGRRAETVKRGSMTAKPRP